MKTKNSLLTLSTLALLAPACSSEQNSFLDDAMPFSVGDSEPSLGNGYDSLSQVLLDTSSCVAGEESDLQSTQIVSDMSQSLDREQIDKEFVGEVNGTPRLAFVNVDAAGGLYSAANSGDFNHSIVYSTKVITGGRKLLNANLKESFATLNTTDILKRCGDQYVSQINTGGRLSVVLNFIFSSATDRNKKQSLNQLSGPWVKVKADIRDKVEKKELTGTLEVKLNQQGGDLSAARLDGAICDLKDSEDLENCLETVTEMIRYAESEFTNSVKDNPAILDYVTSPLSRLSVSGDFPSVPADILTIRRELKADKDRFESAKGSLSKSQNEGFDLSDYERQLNGTLALIQETAKQCYDYGFGSSGVAWDACYTSYQAYQKSVTNQKLVQFGEVAANEPLSYYILNNYNNEMKVEVNIDESSKWTIDGSNYVGYQPNSGECGASCPNSEAAKGQLLYLKNGRYEPMQQNLSVRLQPGEALFFTANDSLSGFNDNDGSIKLSWQCTNCESDWTSLPYEKLTVDADASTETILNIDADGQHRVFAAGFWSPGKARFSLGSKKWYGPEGFGGECDECVSDYHPLASLLIQEQNAMLPAPYTEPVTLNAKKGHKYYFSFNDSADDFGNNSGRMNVLVTCLTCIEK